MKFLCGVLFMMIIGCKPEPAISKEPASNGFAVIELFTSEGCSSCPPAESLIREVANNYQDKDVLVLSYHVDYWDRLGWKDPFSSAANTNRQRHYKDVFKLNSVYTPQAVVNGTTEFVGSNRSRMLQAIESSGQSNIQIVLTADAKPSNSVFINYEAEEAGQNQNVLIALVEKQNFTEVKRGENAGKKLSHINIVRIFETLDRPPGDIQFSLPGENAEDFFITLLLQDDKSGRITGFTTAVIK